MFDEIMANDVLVVQMLFHFDDVYEMKVLIDDEVKQQVMIDDDYVHRCQRIEKKKKKKKEHDEV